MRSPLGRVWAPGYATVYGVNRTGFSGGRPEPPENPVRFKGRFPVGMTTDSTGGSEVATPGSIEGFENPSTSHSHARGDALASSPAADVCERSPLSSRRSAGVLDQPTGVGSLALPPRPVDGLVRLAPIEY